MSDQFETLSKNTLIAELRSSRIYTNHLEAEIERLNGLVAEWENHAGPYQDAEIERLRAALTELLSGHDNLYVAHFGPDSNPHDDIAAKPARRALEPK